MATEEDKRHFQKGALGQDVSTKTFSSLLAASPTAQSKNLTARLVQDFLDAWPGLKTQEPASPAPAVARAAPPSRTPLGRGPSSPKTILMRAASRTTSRSSRGSPSPVRGERGSPTPSSKSKLGVAEFVAACKDLAAHADSLMQGTIIVGNGRSVLGSLAGSAVDSFQTVVRFNDFQIEGYADSVGQKTDLWVVSDWTAIKLLKKYPERLSAFPVLIAIPFRFMGKPYYAERRAEVRGRTRTPAQRVHDAPRRTAAHRGAPPGVAAPHRHAYQRAVTASPCLGLRRLAPDCAHAQRAASRADGAQFAWALACAQLEGELKAWLTQIERPGDLGRIQFVPASVAEALIQPPNHFGDRWPSSGLITISHMLNFEQQPKVHLHGFDFFKEIDVRPTELSNTRLPPPTLWSLSPAFLRSPFVTLPSGRHRARSTIWKTRTRPTTTPPRRSGSASSSCDRSVSLSSSRLELPRALIRRSPSFLLEPPPPVYYLEPLVESAEPAAVGGGGTARTPFRRPRPRQPIGVVRCECGRRRAPIACPRSRLRRRPPSSARPTRSRIIPMPSTPAPAAPRCRAPAPDAPRGTGAHGAGAQGGSARARTHGGQSLSGSHT